MDCELIDADLVGYHFDALADEPRLRVEAHLPMCARCAASFVALKRAVERGADAPDRPSEVARARLRGEVSRRLGASRRKRNLGLAAAAMAVVAALGVGALELGAGRVTPAAPPKATVDSARLEPVSASYL